MTPKLYTTSLSPPARAVLMAERAIGVKLEHEELDMLKGEHVQDYYLKMNPQHSIPTLVDDDGTVVWDSHAIMAYLVAKYNRYDLYPRNMTKRAIVDQRLHFDSGNVFCLIRSICLPRFKGLDKEICSYAKIEAENSYNTLNEILDGKDWVTGDSITIADFSLITSVTSLDHLLPIDPKYTNLLAWIDRAKALPYYDVNENGLEAFYEFIEKIS